MSGDTSEGEYVGGLNVGQSPLADFGLKRSSELGIVQICSYGLKNSLVIIGGLVMLPH